MTTPKPTPTPPLPTAPKLNQAGADRLCRIALGHATREYPHKLDHVLTGQGDVASPSQLHPVFFGSFDWHSCVHAYWMLARLYRLYPDGRETGAIRLLFDEMLTPAKISGEVQYLSRAMSSGFERPYGWAWALALAAELTRHSTTEGRRWHAAVRPLGEAFSDRFLSYLPRATYPVRAGVHSNTAFALIHALDYARTCGDHALWDVVFETGTEWYGNDENCQAWEPDGDAFLSPALTEAALMAELVVQEDFAEWFDGFLPDAEESLPRSLFLPATVSDRSDGKIAHLDGLNLSRAWALGKIARVLTPEHSAYAALVVARTKHLAAALPHLSGEYAGEHWLASFALLALEAQP